MVIKKDVTQCTMWLIEAVSYNAFIPNVNVVEDSTLAHILPRHYFNAFAIPVVLCFNGLNYEFCFGFIAY